MSEYMKGLRALVGHHVLVVPAAAVFVSRGDGKLLLLRDSASGLWSNPGGAIDPGEDPAEAARRELHEETGLVAGHLTLLGAYGGDSFLVTYPNGDRSSYVVIAYGTCKVEGETALQKDEVDAAAWVDRTTVRSMPLSPEMDAMLQDAFRWAELCEAAARPSGAHELPRTGVGGREN